MKFFSKKNIIIFLLFFFVGCNANQSEVNLQKLDEVYGYCDNPQRNIQGREYSICKSKEKANFGEPLTTEQLTTSLTDFLRGAQENSFIGSYSATNTQLWQGSLKVLSPFPIKIADKEGGYIETDWIIENNTNQETRCQIKALITSPELVSNGVETKINCQNYVGQNWISDQKEYLVEEKNLTLKILQSAKELEQ